LPLSLKQAIDLALAPQGNVRVQLAEELIRQALARSVQSRAALLPNLDSSVSLQNQTRNLAAFGIRIAIPIPGFVSPEFVGPFNTFDARATLSQSIFDLSSIRRFQASRAGLQSTRMEKESTDDQVANQVARAYLTGLRAEARVEANRANVTLGETLLKLAQDQKAAGAGTGIEVIRAQVQLANERQRLLVDENERREARLQLLRAMGLKLDGELQLTDKLVSIPMEPMTLERALSEALQSRSDFKAQQQREQSARLNYGAAKWEKLPSVLGFGDYGSIGSFERAIPTRTYGVSVRVPVFDGGRREARRSESLSQFRQEQIKTKDLREQIELEIRLGLDRLASAEQQVKVAEEGLELAQGELAQAQRRYQSGLTTGIEVTDAQARLERARDNQIAALFNYNLARIDLGQAMGNVRRLIP
jgi:outer membrane protein TolC